MKENNILEVHICSFFLLLFGLWFKSGVSVLMAYGEFVWRSLALKPEYLVVFGWFCDLFAAYVGVLDDVCELQLRFFLGVSNFLSFGSPGWLEVVMSGIYHLLVLKAIL